MSRGVLWAVETECTFRSNCVLGKCATVEHSLHANNNDTSTVSYHNVDAPIRHGRIHSTTIGKGGKYAIRVCVSYNLRLFYT